MVYLVNSLYLETFVMQDNHVKLTATTLNTTTISNNIKPTYPQQEKPSKQQHIFGWLKKLASPPKATTAVSEGIKRGFSMIKKQPQQDPKQQQDDSHPYLNLRRQIDKALISSSPECYFSYPSLLNKLVDDENKIFEYKRVTALMANTAATSSTSTLKRPSLRRKSSSFLKRFSSGSNFMSQVIEVPLPQSILAYMSIRAPGVLLAESNKGLEHLLLDTASIDSFNQHQKIAVGYTCYPIGCPDRPCLGPVMIQIDYFRFEAPVQIPETLYPRLDQSLGDTIRHWYKQSQSTCQHHIDELVQFVPELSVVDKTSVNHNAAETPAIQTRNSESSLLLTPFFATTSSAGSNRHCSKFHGCQQPLIDHTRSFTHGTGRVFVYTSVEETTCTRDNKDTLLTCVSCSLCDASTPYAVLSHQAASYSFAKYLELLFYSKKFASPEENLLCEHRAAKSTLVRQFLYNGVTFKFMYEDASYYDLRLPRLQITQCNDDEEEEKKISFSEPRISVLKEWKNKVKQDIDEFFEAAGSTAQLDSDHAAMVQVLMETPENELNDVRRHFMIQSERILAYFQQDNWKDKPDYIKSKDVHCFPGSSVLVRESEPTSIIAYTLSSNEYFQELLRDRDTLSNHGSESSSESTADKKPLPPQQVIDGYYSSIERKYIHPSTGATTETASFRTMITEVVKSSVAESSIVKSNSTKRYYDDLKERWTRKQEESKLENYTEADLKRKLTERVLKPLHAVQQQETTKEVKVASFYEEGSNKKTISPHIKHSKKKKNFPP